MKTFAIILFSLLILAVRKTNPFPYGRKRKGAVRVQLSVEENTCPDIRSIPQGGGQWGW
jgi:hypothetical protein